MSAQIEDDLPPLWFTSRPTAGRQIQTGATAVNFKTSSWTLTNLACESDGEKSNSKVELNYRRSLFGGLVHRGGSLVITIMDIGRMLGRWKNAKKVFLKLNQIKLYLFASLWLLESQSSCVWCRGVSKSSASSEESIKEVPLLVIIKHAS